MDMPAYDTNAEPSGDFSPIPAGEYRAKVIEASIEEISNKSNKGRCLKLTWQVETGAYDGRLVWQRINAWPENMGPNTDKVRTIAESQIASVRIAIGNMAPRKTEEFLHIPCLLYVVIKTDEGFAPQNEVKSVKAVGGAPANTAPAQRTAPAQVQRQAAPAANSGGSAPWRKTA